jgi:hypothetical protein
VLGRIAYRLFEIHPPPLAGAGGICLGMAWGWLPGPAYCSRTEPEEVTVNGLGRPKGKGSGRVTLETSV